MNGITSIDVAGFVIITILTLVFFFNFLPRAVEMLVKTVSLTSTWRVSEEISSLISTSASAPYEIEINYKIPDETVKYKISTSDRFVHVSILRGGVLGETSPADSKILVDVNEEAFESASEFIIKKFLTNGETQYVIKAK